MPIVAWHLICCVCSAFCLPSIHLYGNWSAHDRGRLLLMRSFLMRCYLDLEFHILYNLVVHKSCSLLFFLSFERRWSSVKCWSNFFVEQILTAEFFYISGGIFCRHLIYIAIDSVARALVTLFQLTIQLFFFLCGRLRHKWSPQTETNYFLA